ncbi:hypothetical protein E2C01_005899 [Portunus trituberculatus]|uniref:Uncharacterized protein n=1 Tax=Portunus trituberculatus TaxID=210409 RepID=A0A5B7CTK5_PORTR|nr:hypothetical protein [Portunus trituberculatus]
MSEVNPAASVRPTPQPTNLTHSTCQPATNQWSSPEALSPESSAFTQVLPQKSQPSLSISPVTAGFRTGPLGTGHRLLGNSKESRRPHESGARVGGEMARGGPPIWPTPQSLVHKT